MEQRIRPLESPIICLLVVVVVVFILIITALSLQASSYQEYVHVSRRGLVRYLRLSPSHVSMSLAIDTP